MCRRIFASVEQRVEAYACSDGVQESEIRRKCLVSSTARMIAKVHAAARRCLHELDGSATNTPLHFCTTLPSSLTYSAARRGSGTAYVRLH